MRLLLDTHTFLWWDLEPARLSPLALTNSYAVRYGETRTGLTTQAALKFTAEAER